MNWILSKRRLARNERGLNRGDHGSISCLPVAYRTIPMNVSPLILMYTSSHLPTRNETRRNNAVRSIMSTTLPESLGFLRTILGNIPRRTAEQKAPTREEVDLSGIFLSSAHRKQLTRWSSANLPRGQRFTHILPLDTLGWAEQFAQDLAAEVDAGA